MPHESAARARRRRRTERVGARHPDQRRCRAARCRRRIDQGRGRSGHVRGRAARRGLGRARYGRGLGRCDGGIELRGTAADPGGARRLARCVAAVARAPQTRGAPTGASRAATSSWSAARTCAALPTARASPSATSEARGACACGFWMHEGFCTERGQRRCFLGSRRCGRRCALSGAATLNTGPLRVCIIAPSRRRSESGVSCSQRGKLKK